MESRLSPGDEIPNGEFLFRYCSPMVFPEGQEDIPISIFNDLELSCDWEYYMKNPSSSFHISEGLSVVIKISVCQEIKDIENPKRSGQIVKDWHQDIIYSPIAENADEKHGANEAHSLIKGRKKAPVTQALSNHSILFLRCDKQG